MTTTTQAETKTRLSELAASPEAAPLAKVEPAAPVAVPAPPVMQEKKEPLLFDSQMSHSEDIGTFALALSKAQGAFTKIERTLSAHVVSKRTNTEFEYDYAPLDVVLDAVRPALSANEIALMQFPSAGKGAVKVLTMLVHSSGQWFKNVLAVGGPDFGDPQGVGSSITYARRYALEAMLGISPAHDDDGGAGTESVQRQQQGASVRPGPVAMPQRQTAAPPPRAAAAAVSPVGAAGPPPGPSPQTPAPGAGFTVRNMEKRQTSGTPPKAYWLVEFSNGVVASTFSATMGAAIEKAKQEGTVFVDAVLTKKNGYTYIDSLEPQEAAW